jgi:FAD/FMN-containing dehydrogenase
MATTAHGSGDKTVSTVWDTLLEITWVDGKGDVHVSKPTDPEFRGMVGSVGSFGIITELLVQMTPPSATTLITVRKNDTDMLKDLEELLKVGGD